MTTFISHSFQNQPEFENIVDALQQRNIPYWNPLEVKAGSSLREQLRSAVTRCDVCVFVATRSSIESSWCGAELGAFWGAGKPILVYVAEPSLKDDELPPIVHGDVWERRISRIAERAKEVIESASATGAGRLPKASAAVGQLTVEQFEKLIVGAVSLAAASAKGESGPANFQSVESAAKNVAGNILSAFRATETSASRGAEVWRNRILWVDDRPDNNIHERQAMESMGIEFVLAASTREALQILADNKFAAVISDMGRKEGSREGYVLLDAVRENDKTTPFFIYAGSRLPEHQREAALRGAQGTTNLASELVSMVTQALQAGS